MGCDVSQLVIKKCEKIAQRDAVAKCADWFKSSIPVIVKRDGRGAFERTKRKISPRNDLNQKSTQNDPKSTQNDLIYPILKQLRTISQDPSRYTFDDLRNAAKNAKTKIKSFDPTSLRCFISLFFQILFELFPREDSGLEGTFTERRSIRASF